MIHELKINPQYYEDVKIGLKPFEIRKNEDVYKRQINNIGYSKRLKGHSPTTLEGKIVSDVDMLSLIHI